MTMAQMTKDQEEEYHEDNDLQDVDDAFGFVLKAIHLKQMTVHDDTMMKGCCVYCVVMLYMLQLMYKVS